MNGELSPLLLHPDRLSIMAVLATTRWAEFDWLRDCVGMPADALSAQLRNMTGPGYLEARNGRVGRRSVTWLNLSATGRELFRDHLESLRHIAGLGTPRGRTGC